MLTKILVAAAAAVAIAGTGAYIAFDGGHACPFSSSESGCCGTKALASADGDCCASGCLPDKSCCPTCCEECEAGTAPCCAAVASAAGAAAADCCSKKAPCCETKEACCPADKAAAK